MAVRVVLAEDNYLVREGVRQLIEALPGIELAAVCEDRDSLLGAVAEHRPDVVLTDIRMPPGNSDEGLQVAEWLRLNSPGTGVVVLSQYVESEYALALLEKGAAGRAYLLKERISDVAQLRDAILVVAAGGSVIDSRVVEALVVARSRSASPLDTLTPREREVLSEVAQGKNNAAIAKALFLSDRAVEKHINAIFSKLGLSEEIDVHRRVKATLVYLGRTPA
ncbi:MAG TPA: response regulator transcription factor [Candidatus Dormibacteraeota bacterium]|jgi:DNA-binding NarL/FixJ family response regulator|nr:response regulator transcription factor [Candidatus Dormibacteraeota bacterium]